MRIRLIFLCHVFALGFAGLPAATPEPWPNLVCNDCTRLPLVLAGARCCPRPPTPVPQSEAGLVVEASTSNGGLAGVYAVVGREGRRLASCVTDLAGQCETGYIVGGGERLEVFGPAGWLPCPESSPARELVAGDTYELFEFCRR